MMSVHIGFVLLGLVFNAVGIIIALFVTISKFRKDILTEVDKKFDAFKSDINKRFDAIDKRFEKIEATLETIQQNHLDHITQLHVNPHVIQPSNQEESS